MEDNGDFCSVIKIFTFSFLFYVVLNTQIKHLKSWFLMLKDNDNILP